MTLDKFSSTLTLTEFERPPFRQDTQDPPRVVEIKTDMLFSLLSMPCFLSSRRPSLRPFSRCFASYVLIVMIALCTTGTPSITNLLPQRIDETRTPPETKEEAREKFEESRASSKRRFRLNIRHHECGTEMDQAVCSSLFLPSDAPRSVRGHRLSNAILAPLTC